MIFRKAWALWKTSGFYFLVRPSHPVSNNDLLTGLLSPYWETRSPIFFVRPELASLRKSEGFVFLLRTEQPGQ